jgi:hypothetical protein
VANHDWDGFIDAGWIGRAENAVLAALTVGAAGQGDPSPVAFWQRIELEDGIQQNDIGGDEYIMSLPETVHLLRNVAQITVDNQTATEPAADHYLSDVYFAVGNRYDRGTVAPYDPVTGSFGIGNDADDNLPDDDFVTQAAGTPIPISGDGDFRAEGAYIDMYERRNQGATDNSYLIIRARFDDSPTPSYYKIELIEDESDDLIDIGRNWRYQVKIISVKAEGYATPGEAMSGLASNNVTASVVASEYTDISDETGVLHVDRTAVTFVEPNRPFTIGYFFEMAGGGRDNNVTVALANTNGVAVAEGVSAAGGVISGTTGPALPTNDIFRAVITITKGDLSRTIDIDLRQKMNFAVTTTPVDGVVAEARGTDTEIRFTVPDDISPRLFPVPVRIYTKRYTPEPGQDLSIEVPAAGGDYYYLYNAPFLGVGAVHTIRLESNSDATDETIRIASDLFNDNDQAVFTN